jgi:membrane protease YdiL (CAAX protease family)
MQDQSLQQWMSLSRRYNKLTVQFSSSFPALLFRALDREWGGWRAVVGSAAFFAVYHLALSWPPVFLLGALNALLFKNSGRLLPAVLLHMAYNAVVLS